MKKIILALSVAVFAFPSCKKCITCKKTIPATQTCASCTNQGNTITLCESDLAGYGVDQFVADMQATGYTCTKTPGTPAQNFEEKLCWQTDNAHNTAVTARSSLEVRGYTCSE